MLPFKDDGPSVPTMTRSSGEPIANYRSVLTVGPRGPPLMEDHVFLEDIQHVNRGRIPERIIHAKGTGVHGYFEVTNDITKYCDSALFSEVGKRTPIFTRFSVAASQLGSADTSVRGVRGMGVKFYTEEGNWDLTLLSEPVFIINDTLKIFSSSNAGSPNPRSNLPDQNANWDFITQTPDMIHFVLWQHSDTGLPDGYRYMDTHALNTYKLINAHGEQVYVRFHIKSDQGVRNLTPERAIQLAGANPDYAAQDLIEAVQRGDFPTYSLKVQIMSFEQAEALDFNPFDVTMIWPQKDFPLIEVGRLTLNRNVQNHWDETEQAVFFPGSFIPGIRPSPDKVLAARIFSYQDTQNYRMGSNRYQLPINRPLNPVANYQRDGRNVYISQGAAPHYFPNSFGGTVESERAQELDPPYKWCGDVKRHDEVEIDYFSQSREFWRNFLDDDHRSRVVNNLATSLRTVEKAIQRRAIKMFSRVDEEISEKLEAALEKDGI